MVYGWLLFTPFGESVSMAFRLHRNVTFDFTAKYYYIIYMQKKVI